MFTPEQMKINAQRTMILSQRRWIMALRERADRAEREAVEWERAYREVIALCGRHGFNPYTQPIIPEAKPE